MANSNANNNTCCEQMLCLAISLAIFVARGKEAGEIEMMEQFFSLMASVLSALAFFRSQQSGDDTVAFPQSN